MPIRSEWKLAREGITADTFGRLLSKTVFNPVLTLPLFLLARYTERGNILSATHQRAFKNLKTIFILSIAAKLSAWLDDAVSNNWSKDTYDWSKEVVVVTGGSDGIGKLIVELLAERGIKVGVLDVQELTYEAPPSVQFFKCDLASRASIARASASLKAALGDPTVLINNAGVAKGKTILDATESDIRLTFSVNTFAHYFLAHEFLPAMVRNNHGTIVTVASLAAYVTAPSMVDYAASKAAALSFHEGLASELSTVYKAPKVRSIIMCQNYTRTKLFEGFHGKFLYPETVAEEIVKAVLKGRSAHLVLPETAWQIAPRLRGYPLWIQSGIRKRLDVLMKHWRGRQVVQPSEEKEKEGKGVEESAVLVPKEL